MLEISSAVALKGFNLMNVIYISRHAKCQQYGNGQSMKHPDSAALRDKA
jgi:hypothetical protein